MVATQAPTPPGEDIPRGLWVLGLLSMFMDISSEMIHALLPIHLVAVHGTSMTTVGFIEGIAEATAMITKVFSGALSDWLGKRKLLDTGPQHSRSRCFPLRAPSHGLSRHASSTALARGIGGAPRDVRWWLTSRPSMCEAPISLGDG